jgi:hypothetical protein
MNLSEIKTYERFLKIGQSVKGKNFSKDFEEWNNCIEKIISIKRDIPLYMAPCLQIAISFLKPIPMGHNCGILSSNNTGRFFYIILNNKKPLISNTEDFFYNIQYNLVMEMVDFFEKRNSEGEK